VDCGIEAIPQYTFGLATGILPATRRGRGLFDRDRGAGGDDPLPTSGGLSLGPIPVARTALHCSASRLEPIAQGLRKTVTVNKGGRPVRMAVVDVISNRVLESSMKGDFKAIHFVLQSEQEAAEVQTASRGEA